MLGADGMVRLTNVIITKFLMRRNLTHIDSITHVPYDTQNSSDKTHQYNIKNYAFDMDKNGYITVAAINNNPRNKRKFVIILIFKEDSGTMLTQSNIKQTIERMQKNIEDELDEIIITSSSDNCKKQGVISGVESFKIDGSKSLDLEGKYPYYNLYPFDIFCTDIPAHVESHKHEIMSPAEVEQLLKDLCKPITSLQIEKSDDPQVVWVGARPGQVLRVISPSSITGEMIVYKYVRS